MKLRRILSKTVERDDENFSVRAALDAVVAVNVNEPRDEAEPPTREEPAKEAPDG